MISKLKSAYSFTETAYPLQAKIARFILSGGTATAVNLLIVFLLTHFLHIWYLLSSVIGFSLSFIISFYLQKFWTFKHSSKSNIKAEFFSFFVCILLGLLLNTFLVYVFVEFALFHYLFAQIVSGVIVAIMNYFLYKNVVFRKTSHENI